MKVSTFDRIEAVLRGDAVYELAELVPQREDGDAGRPREFPDYMMFVFEALISIYGSARKAEAEVAHRHVWHFIRRTVKKAHKNDRSMWLPPQRYKRHHYAYGRNRYLTDPMILQRIQETHREIAARQAAELDLLDPDGEGSFTRPSLDRLVYADGKVVTPLYKAKPGTTRVDKETGEIKPVRFEADADLHMEGTGEMAFGIKFLMTAVRTSDVHGRIILDAEHVPDKGGEAKVALQSFNAIAPHSPGIQGVVYDTALRGKHHNELMQRLGWLSINRVQGAEVVTVKGKQVKRVEKTVHIEDKTVNGQTYRLFARGGAVCVAELTETGEQELTELRRVRTTRRDGKGGLFRWYNEYALPDGGTVTVRIDTTAEDVARKLNRAENVRQLPPTDPDFKRIYRRRADIESINRNLEDTLFLNRAHSKGADRQLVNLIGYAIVVNALAVHLHRQRAMPHPESNLPSVA
jgi:hypothetical protein